MDKETEILVTAYLEGELDDAQADDLARRLEASPADRAELLALARQERILRAMLSPARDLDKLVLGEIRARQSGGRFVDEVMEGRSRRRRGHRRRAILALTAAAAAAVLLVGTLAAVWLGRGAPRPVTTPPIATPPSVPPAVAVAPGWRIEPTGTTVFHAIAPDRIRLDRGELFVESAGLDDGAASRSELTIETPVATARAAGTSFYIGNHVPLPGKTKGRDMKTTQLTRVLVLSGVVTLASSLGSSTGGANELLAAEQGQAPVKVAAQANSDFALDLYAQLAKENAGKNLFFSPYSMSVALAMTAEGARGETAAEMGKVLRYPEAARRTGDDVQLLPWRMAMIHTGVSELSQRLTGEMSAADKAAAQAEIDRLRKACDEAAAEVERLAAAEKWREVRGAKQAQKQAAAKLNAALVKVDQYELRIANALWGEKTYPFLDSYLDTINKFYWTGSVRQCDFRHNFPAERQRINEYIEQQTANRIKDLIPDLPPDEAQDIRLILTNATYFKGEWSQPFKPTDTKDLPFALGGGKSVQTPIMNAGNLDVARYGAFNADGSFFKTPAMIQPGQKDGIYPGEDGFAMVELPYKGDDLSMVAIAPNSADGLAAVEKKLTAANLSAWIGKIEKREVNVLLPKFKLETDYQMTDTLKAMGMVRAFTDPRWPNGADFTGMSASKSMMDRLYIAKVLHKAFVEVNEKGTEAAAATAVMMAKPVGISFMVPFTPMFTADRPFIFLIRDVKTGTILFLGRMTNPKQ